MHEREITAPEPPPLYGTRESAAGLPYAASRKQPHPHQEPMATPGQRLAARVLDIVAVGVLLVIVETPMWLVLLSRDPNLRALVTNYFAGPASQEQAEAVQQSLLLWSSVSSIILVALWFCYEVPMMARRGQTLGKLALSIRATTATPTRLGWRAATVRWLVLGLPSLFGIYGLPVQLLDCGWLLRDAGRRCLHDKLARTAVVRTNAD